MTKISRTEFDSFQSDNRKSKTCTELRRSNKNRKSAGIVALFVTLAMGEAVVQAQQPSKMYRIGLLLPSSAGVYSRRVEGFHQGLEKLGYVEGKNVVLEQRYAEGVSKQLTTLALELVSRKVDVIVTSSSAAIVAISRASSTMPIVFTAIGPDPVEAGFISSFAKPGGNITGITIIAPDLDGKRLELLHEFSPKSQRIALLRKGGKLHDLVFSNLASPAKAMGLQLLPLRVKGAGELEAAFEKAKSNRAQALLALPDPLFSTHQRRIVELASRFRLPAIYHNGDFVEAGGLMSYGPDIVENYRRAATYVDKILKGAKPADLPVEQPTKFEFLINLKTAKQIGVTIPPNVLARADRVIR